MKILTNFQSVQVGGITQSNVSFSEFLNKHNEQDINLVGIDIIRMYFAPKKLQYQVQTTGKIKTITQEVICSKIHDVLKKIKILSEVEKEYKQIIKIFKKHILEEQPDLIVINGTYFIPWCLYLAAREFNIPMILHYHGVLTKETAGWDSHSHKLMKEMERTFDNSRLYYIFPSVLAKNVVEAEVFGHPISQSAILPNSIPASFFKINTNILSRNIGMVGRWSDVKNPTFIHKLAEYNLQNNSYFKINVVTEINDLTRKQRSLSKMINFYPPMSSSELGQFYGKMGVIICPSFFETYGNVPQEAVASGTPALIGSNMGVAEVFRKLGLEHLITDFTSVESVYKKLKSISKERVDEKIRNKMKRKLSPNKVHSKLINIYKLNVF